MNLSKTGSDNNGSTALHCTACLQQLTALLTLLVTSSILFCDLKTSSTQIRLWPDLSS